MRTVVGGKKRRSRAGIRGSAGAFAVTIMAMELEGISMKMGNCHCHEKNSRLSFRYIWTCWARVVDLPSGASLDGVGIY